VARTSKDLIAMPGRIDAKLAELGITLPTPAAPLANYIGYNFVGNLVIVSGPDPPAGRQDRRSPASSAPASASSRASTRRASASST
jgi:hypothetical protein